MKILTIVLLITILPLLSNAQCPDKTAGIIWHSNRSKISFRQLAEYAAPMLWFSPDEILLLDENGEKQLPKVFPFDIENDKPTVYYKLRTVYGLDRLSSILNEKSPNKDLHVLDLETVRAIDLDFYYYFAEEDSSLGHQHDIESVTMKIQVSEYLDCSDFKYAIQISQVTGRAHGLHWYNNVLEVDAQTVFPISILIEEGKHASCTDKNADGVYTPTYDVNKRTHDAWGIRDIIISGKLTSGGYQAWMTKVRDKSSIVFPPTPKDSPCYKKYQAKFGDYIEESQYELRPYPDYKKLRTENKVEDSLIPFMRTKKPHDWPTVDVVAGNGKVKQWIKDERAFRSLSLAYRLDGAQRMSLSFPLLIFKNVEAPIKGGWFYHKLYFGDIDAFRRDSSFAFEGILGHQITYSSSASKWIDTYMGVGYEIYDLDRDASKRKYQTYLVSEVGIKFRVNIGSTKLRFLRHLGTDFWGVKVGWKNLGFSPFVNSGFVLEIGAGVF